MSNVFALLWPVLTSFLLLSTSFHTKQESIQVVQEFGPRICGCKIGGVPKSQTLYRHAWFMTLLQSLISTLGTWSIISRIKPLKRSNFYISLLLIPDSLSFARF